MLTGGYQMMNRLKAYTLTILLSTLTFAQESHAATIAPPLATQVKQVAQWFTGLFDNAEQVASDSSVPFLSMSSCAVQLVGGDSIAPMQSLYLEQKSSFFQRIRFYGFSEEDSAINLSVRSFLNQNILSGICNQPKSERIIDISNLAATSCDVEIMWEPLRYIGTNAPNGCPTSTGGKVVSTVSIFDSGITSLDQIYNAQGIVISNTPIKFRRIHSIPEPNFTFGILAFGLWSTNKVLSGKLKNKSIEKKKTSV